MKIWLLTHENEVLKKTNTGRLVTQVLASEVNEITVSAEIIQWSRVRPNDELLEALITNQTLLIYPAKDALTCHLGWERTSDESHQSLKDSDLVLLDGTWQQAQKIFNKSPYLHSLKKLHLITQRPSQYTLRRNQVEGGLCTVETVIEILRSVGHLQSAEVLQDSFEEFLAQQLAPN